MSNPPVPASAEGMSTYPRNPHRFGFVRELLMRWGSRASTASVNQTLVQESFMNQHVDRRRIVASTAAAAALGTMIPFNHAEATPIPETAVGRVHRLARELSCAMDAWMEDIGGAPDEFVAEIYPSKAREYAIGFRHNLAGWSPDEKLFELEAAFHAEWAALRAMEPELNAAERRYMEVRMKRPVMPEMTSEEIDAMRSMTIAEIQTRQPSRASIEHAEAIRVFDKADAAARRKTGYGKLDRAYTKQTHRTADAANALLRLPAKTVAGLAAKERVHRVWEFDGEDFNFIMDDIANLAPGGR